MIVVKFSTIAGGVFVEVAGEERNGNSRCFRFDKEGNAEWAALHDLERSPSPRWFGHVFKSSQFVIC